MNSEVKALWVADLRANADKQAKRVLTTINGKDCCLGRLCKLAVAAGVIDPPQSMNGEVFYGEDSITLPNVVMKWAGLSNYQGDSATINGRYCGLSEHNDSGRTFLEIADAIEREL